jgi:hypothetical protein
MADIELEQDPDEEDITNPNIDLNEYGLAYSDHVLSFYCSVHGSIIGGTVIPAAPDYLSLKPPVDDNPPVSPSDIEPVPPDEIIPLPELVGEDTISIFIDTDNSTLTGFKLGIDDNYIDNSLGADRMIEIAGKYGEVKHSGFYTFSGHNAQDWNWEYISNINVGNDNFQLETQLDLNRLGLDMAEPFKVVFYAHDWNNQTRDRSNNNLNFHNPDLFNIGSDLNESLSRGDYVLIEIDDEGQIELLNEEYGIEIVESYENFVMANITINQQYKLEQQGFPNRITRLNERTMLNLNTYKFDTRQGPPTLSQELMIESYPQKTSGMYIVQFIGPIKQTWLAKFEEIGAKVCYYLPSYAYLALMNNSVKNDVNNLSFVQWIDIYQPGYKILPEVEDGNVKIIILNTSTSSYTIDNFLSTLNSSIVGYDSYFDHYYLVAKATGPQIIQTARNNDVVWIESYSDPVLNDETSSEIVGGFWMKNVPWNGPGVYANSLGWNGTNVIVSVADTGIGDGTVGDAGHLDFEDRIIGGTQYGTLTSWVDGNAHGTHVAGIIGGDGYEGTGTTYPTSSTSTYYYVGLGVAPDAKLYAQRIFGSNGAYSGPSSWDSFFQDAYNAGAYIHANSWGEGTGDSAYEADDIEYDEAVRDSATSTSGDQPMVIVVSAGNSGPNSGTIKSPSSAKNVITVGATENYHPDAVTYGELDVASADNIDDIASFSSRGLEDDGRIKPDLMAPGTVVLSANSSSGSDVLHGVYSLDNRYLWCSGTSQASPHVSGSAACIVEWWKSNHSGTEPSPALVKAVLINTAIDVDKPDIPNGNEGWGRIYIPDIFTPPANLELYEQGPLLMTGNKSNYDVYVASNDQPLKITMVWTDPAGTALANPVLVNNLDLKVTAPDNSTIYYGNVFKNGMSTSGTQNASSNWDTDSDGFDERNNVECVYIPTKDLQPGIYKIEIIGDNIVTDAVSNTTNTDQDYALVISGELSEPNDVGIDSLEAPNSHKKNHQAKIVATVKNYGMNDQTSSFNVRCIIKNPTGTEVYNSTKTVSSLKIFENVDRSWTFTPLVEGEYTIIARTELVNDDNKNNNISTTYLTVPFVLTDAATFTGSQSDDRFGWNVSYAHDVNGDGYSDVIIGAPYNDSKDGSLNDAGAVYIFYGPKKGDYSVDNAEIKIYGTAANDHFGWDVAGVGDVNGTYADVLIGAPGNTSTVAGKAYLFTGWTLKNDLDGELLASNADVTINGESNGDRFGNSVSGAGNVDQAGYNDLMIGAYLQDNNAKTNNGRVYIFYGDGSIPTSAGSADRIINGTFSNELFGFSVSSAGDMDNDNFDDIVIGAPGANGSQGRAYILGGYITVPSGNVSYNFTSGGGKDKWFYHKNTETVTPPGSGPDITGESELSSYSTIAKSDDVRTPQHPDSENSGTQNAYNCHHFRFTINEPVSSINSITVLWEGYNTKVTTDLYIWNFGTSSWQSIGTGATGGDDIIETTYTTNLGNYINSGGRLDLVVTAKDGAKALWRYLYTDFVNVELNHDPYIDNSFKSTITGENSNDNLGWSVNCSGDVNGDSFSDVVIGSPGFDNNRGRAYVIFGNNSMAENLSALDANVSLNGGSEGDMFGYSVGSAYIGPDNYCDILVGAPFNDTWNGSLTDAGAVYVFMGSNSMPYQLHAASHTRSGEEEYDNFGWSVSNAFNVNNGNFNNIVVGAPHYDNGSVSNTGKAYILTFVPEFPGSLLPLLLIFSFVIIIKSKLKNRKIKN